MEFLLVLLILIAVVYIVTGPLRRPEAGPASAQPASDARSLDRENELSELEAAREAKYREIRDTRLDFDTGKLSQADFEALDTVLRRQALEILERIDRLAPSAPEAQHPESTESGRG